MQARPFPRSHTVSLVGAQCWYCGRENKAPLGAPCQCGNEVSLLWDYGGGTCFLCGGDCGWLDSEAVAKHEQVHDVELNSEEELAPFWYPCPRCKGTGVEPGQEQNHEEDFRRKLAADLAIHRRIYG